MSIKKDRKKSYIIGAVTIIALLLFYFGFNFLKGINLFETTSSYYVTFNNARDLTKSTPVSLAGYRVGLVRDLRLDYDGLQGVTLELALEKGLKIPHGSMVSVRSNPISGAELNIILPNEPSGAMYQPGDTLEAYSNSDLLSQVSDDLLPAVAIMINRMDSMLVTFEKVMNNPNINHAFNEMGHAASNIRETTEGLQRIMKYRAPKIAGDLEASMSAISRLVSRTDSLPLEATLQRLERMITEGEGILKQLRSQDNSMGLLLNDDQLYQNVKAVTKSTDSLIIDIRKRPQRYLKLSLF